MASAAIEIVLVALDTESAAIERAAGLLTPEEQARAGRFRTEIDRRRYIAAHATLHRLLATRRAGGEVHFSVSRSEDLAAFAFSRRCVVGIDVEAIRPLGEADAIAARTFPRREWRSYARLPARDRVRGFFRGWTRTEALAKALGGGLALAPAALDDALEDCWLVRSFVPAPGFAGAVAGRLVH